MCWVGAVAPVVRCASSDASSFWESLKCGMQLQGVEVHGCDNKFFVEQAGILNP